MLTYRVGWTGHNSYQTQIWRWCILYIRAYRKTTLLAEKFQVGSNVLAILQSLCMRAGNFFCGHTRFCGIAFMCIKLDRASSINCVLALLPTRNCTIFRGLSVWDFFKKGGHLVWAQQKKKRRVIQWWNTRQSLVSSGSVIDSENNFVGENTQFEYKNLQISSQNYDEIAKSLKMWM